MLRQAKYKNLYLQFNIVGTILCLIFLTGCHVSDKNNSSPHFRGALGERVRTVDPAFSVDVVSVTIMAQIYETLYQYKYGSKNYELEPLLAETMPKVSKDGLVYEIPIRKNVQYHDDPCFEASGKRRQIEAKDFVLSLKRLADPTLDSTGYWTVDNKLKGVENFREKIKSLGKIKTNKARMEAYSKVPLAGAEALSPNLLRIELETPYPQLMYVLAMPYTAPMPEEALAFHNEEIASHPVGTGPYKIESWIRNSKIELVRHDGYWGKQPQIKKATYEIALESQPYWLKFLSGQVDLAGIPKDNFSSVIDQKGKLSAELKEKGIKLIKHHPPVAWFIGYNLRDPFLAKNKLVRKAVAHALNRAKYIRLMRNNRGVVATTLIPPGLDGHRETKGMLDTKYDPQTAAKLLVKAGFPNGQGLPELKYDLRGNSTFARQSAELIQADLAKVGIKIKTVLNTFPKYIEKELKGDLQIFNGGWIADYPDAESFFQLFYGKNHPPGPNGTYYQSKEYDELYEKLRMLPAGKARSKVLKHMIQILAADFPMAMDSFSVSHTLIQPWLRNYKPHPFAYNRLKYYRIEK